MNWYLVYLADFVKVGIENWDEKENANVAGITDSMDMSLSKLQETVKDREA